MKPIICRDETEAIICTLMLEIGFSQNIKA